jgi:hypothetical protein
VAANAGIREAFVEALGLPVTVPEHYNVMGAFGAALVAKGTVVSATEMRSLDEIRSSDFRAETFTCPHCPNECEIVRFLQDGFATAHLGGRCERWMAEGGQATVTVHRTESAST